MKLSSKEARQRPVLLKAAILFTLALGSISCFQTDGFGGRYDVLLQKLVFNVPDGPVRSATLDLGRQTLVIGSNRGERNEYAWEKGNFRLTYYAADTESSWVLEESDQPMASGPFLSDVSLCLEEPVWLDQGNLESVGSRLGILNRLGYVHSIACSDSGLIAFAGGKVLELVDGSEPRLISEPGGLITNAGQLDGSLVWFWKRLNEKAAGTLWVLDVSTGRSINIDTTLGQGQLITVAKVE